MPNGNGAPAALTNTAVANNNPQPPPPPPPPPAEPEASTSTHTLLSTSHNNCLVDLIVNWNGPGGYVSPCLFDLLPPYSLSCSVPSCADHNSPHTSIDPFPDIAWTNTSHSSNRRDVAACSFASFVVSPPSHVRN
ncbi:hypothetical protein FRC18_007899 [Serendipita sp. 400]|nr:hypothetical protein FRC18_007899 [Serendipita sp. 400]